MGMMSSICFHKLILMMTMTMMIRKKKKSMMIILEILQNQNLDLLSKQLQRKKKKKKMKKIPTMSAPKIPSLGDIVGLSQISLTATMAIKMNQKWKVIERVMALRGFDVSDQQTIRILIEDAQKNVDAQNY